MEMPKITKLGQLDPFIAGGYHLRDVYDEYDIIIIIIYLHNTYNIRQRTMYHGRKKNLIMKLHAHVID